MSDITAISEGYDYDSLSHDYRAWRAHHAALIAALEPAQWSTPLSGNRWLTDEQVLDIRQRYAAGGVTLQQLTTEYGYKRDTTISRIVTGETYRNVPGPRTFRRAGSQS